jgi:polyphosphate kinase
MVPVEDQSLRNRLVDEILGLALGDNVKARRLQVDGTYVLVGESERPVRSQMALLEAARRAGIPAISTKPIIRHAAAPTTSDRPIEPPQLIRTGT